MHLPSPLKTIASILLGTMTAWTLSSFVPNQTRAFFAPHPPTLSFSPAAGFDGTDAINPDTAAVGDPLTFSVVYTHPDNHPPVIVLPVLVQRPGLVRAALAHEDNGEEEAITLFVNTIDFSFFTELKLHRDTISDPAFPLLHDGDYTNGEQFSLTVPAGFPYVADYEFYFQATDGEWGHFRYLGAPWHGGPLTFTLTAPLPSNHAPTLSFSQDTDYLTDGVNPEKGTADLTPLIFKAVYTDEDNDPPQNIAIHIDTGTVNLDPIPLVPDTADTIPPALKDGNFTNGEQYAYTGTFPKGQYQYHFEVSDSEESTRLPSTGELSFQTGYSNIAFLPGFLGSRLYQYDYDCLLVNCENQLWDPNIPYLPDVQKLYLDPNGNPIHPDIYTKSRDVIDESLQSPQWPGSNVYKKFIEFMDNEMAGNTINAWEPVSYDWRLPLETTVNSDIQRPANTFTDLVQTIEILASTSANGKVTLIGHSNGGLLAKVLINRLNNEGKASLIDRLIMVGTPQLGTPDVIDKLLHGMGPTNETTREFLENMVSAYNFLPSPVYFQRVASPVIEFDPEVSNIYDFLGIYDANIDTSGEFTKFLLGDNGLRTEPSAGDTDVPNVLKENLLAQAHGTHANLDLWTPPEGIQVIQVAGWGERTKRGIRYDDCDVPFCSQTLSHLDRAPIKVDDGDGTVVIPSAVAMDVSTYPVYYLNLNVYNDDHFINRKHADILEVEELQSLIKQIVQDTLNADNLPNYFGTIKPEPGSEDDRLQIRGLSPISIDVYDGSNFHTGPVSNPDPTVDLEFFEENIPNSVYEKVGEKTYIDLDAHKKYRIEIKGLALGSFTLVIDELFNDEVTDSIAYTNIPVTPSTKAFLTTQTVDTTSSLVLDVEGDGTPDITLTPSDTPDTQASLKVLKSVVNTLSIQKGLKNGITRQIEAAEKLVDRRVNRRAADGILKGLVKQLQNYPKFLINPSDAQALIQIIETIRLSLVK